MAKIKAYEMLGGGGTAGAVTGNNYSYTAGQVFVCGVDVPEGEFAHLADFNCKTIYQGPGRPPKTGLYETAVLTSSEIETQPVQPKPRRKPRTKASKAKS